MARATKTLDVSHVHGHCYRLKQPAWSSLSVPRYAEQRAWTRTFRASCISPAAPSVVGCIFLKGYLVQKVRRGKMVASEETISTGRGGFSTSTVTQTRPAPARENFSSGTELTLTGKSRQRAGPKRERRRPEANMAFATGVPEPAGISLLQAHRSRCRRPRSAACLRTGSRPVRAYARAPAHCRARRARPAAAWPPL